MASDAFVLIGMMMALGYAFGRWRLLPANSAEALNQFALNVCLPAAVLRFAAQLSLDTGLLALIAVPWLLLAASVPIAGLIARWLKLDDGERAVLLLCIPLGNTSFLGYPLVEAFLGKPGLPYAVAYDQFGSFIALSTYGLWVLARYAGSEKPRPSAVLRKMLRFPPFIALIIALTVMPADPPDLVGNLLERLSDALLPIVTLAIGLQLRFRLPQRERAPLALGLLAKLVVLPALALGLGLLFGMDSLMRSAVVLEAAMAPMITASALAISHRLAPGLAAAMVGYGIPISLLTLFGWRVLLGAL